ncbi:hypothetical protein EMCG_08907 [[Emmonsia] crescens]|uniref:Uncharacterized protein n=1 Tax=[Emmonsia] crescens TaxID=73230 RepID=A0A0G2I3Q3_9EURO|nr:hypothetical protein EMCG_08907 [Emmonsia crescens UAMH 3008]
MPHLTMTSLTSLQACFSPADRPSFFPTDYPPPRFRPIHPHPITGKCQSGSVSSLLDSAPSVPANRPGNG